MPFLVLVFSITFFKFFHIHTVYVQHMNIFYYIERYFTILWNISLVILLSIREHFNQLFYYFILFNKYTINCNYCTPKKYRLYNWNKCLKLYNIVIFKREETIIYNRVIHAAVLVIKYIDTHAHENSTHDARIKIRKKFSKILITRVYYIYNIYILYFIRLDGKLL